MATDLAKLHRDVCFGKSNGKIIWQPRIGCWYDDKIFAGEPLPERYQGMKKHEVIRDLGCSGRFYEFYYQCFKRIEHPSVKFTERQISETDTETTIETPAGKQIRVDRKSKNAAYPQHMKWEVVDEDEMRVAIWREENATWEFDKELYDRFHAEVGDLGAPTMFMLNPRMNVQSLYLERMGVENGVMAIYTWTDLVESYFKAVDECSDRLIDVINDSPVDIINFGENVHGGTLSPDLFVQYHLPSCQRRCEKLHAAGKFVSAHWDGDTAPLLQYAKETGLDAIEAITPQPQGDVTLEQVKEALGDDVFLMDGLPAVYFDETYPVETLVECTEKLIELFAPKLILGISDEISSTGDIERVRIVGEIVDRYNAQCR